MGENLTLYRGVDGAPHLVAFRCPHRGTQLSVAWVEDDCLRCRYHGWKFDASGQCVDQPGEPVPFAAKVKIASFPTRDNLGLVYAYVGGGPPPPFPRYPDLENFQGVVLVYPYYHRACNYFQNVENGLDPVHQVFTHREAVGSPQAPPSLEVAESDWGITGHIGYADGTRVPLYLGMPNVQRIRILPSDPEISSLYEALIYKVPVDDEHHLQFMVIGIPMAPDSTPEEREHVRRHIVERCHPHPALVPGILAGDLLLDEVDPKAMLNQDLVWLQDDVVQIGQGDIVDRREERLGREDVGIILLRTIWEREMRALAEGRALKRWTYTAVSFPA
jgi:5,5'-dehydrodivanillate O-demethylase